MDIAKVTDQKIEYSKHKGLDDKKCEALLLDSLKDHGSLTKPEIVRLLWDVLPDQLNDKQKDNKLDYLLKRLRKAGKIWTERNEVTSYTPFLDLLQELHWEFGVYALNMGCT